MNDSKHCSPLECAYAHACGDCESDYTKRTQYALYPDIRQQNFQHDCLPPDIFANNCRKQTLGMAYVPAQKWNSTYDYDTGFMKGTIFPELDMPFQMEGGYHYES